MVSVAYRMARYSALASVVFRNEPRHGRDLAAKIRELFDIYVDPIALNAYLRIGVGMPYYNAIKPTETDRFYLFCLKPEFYICLQNAIMKDTGMEPTAGVKWLAKQYTERHHPRHTPITVFNKAITKFDKNSKKTKTLI
ncbi:MAG TPA: hypothetical protein HA224_00465 [Nanoarchaeota archaeon]|nr:hypothetical protein [Nanoarchaeota archaeon]